MISTRLRVGSRRGACRGGTRSTPSTRAVVLRAHEGSRCSARRLRGSWVRSVASTPVRLLRVLAERELDRRLGTREHQPLRRLAPLVLDHGALAADRVARAMEQVHDGRSAGELAVDVDALRVHDVGDAHLGRHVVGALVDVAQHRRVAVRVDDPGRHVLPGPVDDQRAGRGRACGHGGDLPFRTRSRRPRACHAAPRPHRARCDEHRRRPPRRDARHASGSPDARASRGTRFVGLSLAARRPAADDARASPRADRKRAGGASCAARGRRPRDSRARAGSQRSDRARAARARRSVSATRGGSPSCPRGSRERVRVGPKLPPRTLRAARLVDG